MTDTAIAVTQTAAERFTELYLETCGCSVRTHEDKLVVDVPETASTALLEPGTTTLVCSADPERTGNDRALNPESETFQELLREATTHAPVGRVDLTETDTEIRLPDWLVESDVSVASTQFQPYYDRTAVAGLFQVGVETVSEYQTQLLRVAAIDTTSHTALPALADRLLGQTTPDSTPFEANPPTIDEDVVRTSLESLQEHVVEQVEPSITEIREGATRAAHAEQEEYRQLQDQRIDELETELSRVTEKIEECSEAAEAADEQTERLAKLQERKELKTERDELQADLQELREARSRGFPEKRQEINDRHSLHVTVEPLTVTEYQYEQGELELNVSNAGDKASIRIGYGNGVGITESLDCSRCETTLSSENPLRLHNDEICCTHCHPHTT
ncbi:hypothetical protein [Halarchaeum sp. P4]|uniref:hypothetical protein n=1 Tax=Halarchaeum sp. P4 TaxID=3421639 RepID=UPI003EB735C9